MYGTVLTEEWQDLMKKKICWFDVALLLEELKIIDNLYFIRQRFLITDEAKVKDECTILLRELDDLEPFTACGFFNVDKGALVSVLSTVLTYFVILIQTVQC